MNNEEHEYIVHTIHDNSKKTKTDLEKLTKLLNGNYETMMAFSDGKNENYFLLVNHEHPNGEVFVGESEAVLKKKSN